MIMYFKFHQNQTQYSFVIEGSPLWIFQEIKKFAISSMDVGENFFLD